MGETRARLKIYGTDGKAIELEALVDNGATFTNVPKEMADSLGLKAQYETEVELADGRRVKRCLALAEVELEGVRRPVLVAIGEEGERALIGYTYGQPFPPSRFGSGSTRVYRDCATGGVDPGGDRQGTRRGGALPSNRGMGGEHQDYKVHNAASRRDRHDCDPRGCKGPYHGDLDHLDHRAKGRLAPAVFRCVRGANHLTSQLRVWRE